MVPLEWRVPILSINYKKVHTHRKTDFLVRWSFKRSQFYEAELVNLVKGKAAAVCWGVQMVYAAMATAR